MKLIERFSLRVFSIIIIFLSIITILTVTSVLHIDFLVRALSFTAENETYARITIIVSVILILLGIKSLLARLKPEDESKNGIILENASGKLVISKESLENLIAGVSKNIPGAESISSKTVLDKDRNLKVYVTTVVSDDVVLKDISTDLQKRIKEAMKKTADLDVKEVNIKIKNITSKKAKSKVAKENANTKPESTIETNEEVKQEIDNGEE